MKKRIHSASRDSFLTFSRIMIIVLIAIGMVSLFPFVTQSADIQNFFLNQVVNMGILYAILIGFFTSMSLSRKQAIDEYIQIELNKIRRIYHLGLHLVKAEPRLAPWFEDLKGALREYQDFFCDDLFSNYEVGNPIFRKLTYVLYDLPSRGIPYNSELYQFLLDASTAATEARQYIRSKLAHPIGQFQWVTILLITLTLSSILVASTPADLSARLVTAAVVFNMFLVLELMYEYDRSDVKSERAIAQLYSNNLPEVGECGPETTTGKRKTKKK